MSEIEAELVKLLKFKKAPEDYEDRQEYLVALAEAVDKVKDDTVFDNMTEPAYDWLQDAVEARNKKQEVEDFPDAEPEEVEGDGEPDAEVVEAEAAEGDESAEAAEEAAEEESGKTIEGAETERDSAELEGSEPAGAEPKSEEVEPATPAFEAPGKQKKPRKKHITGGRYIRKKKGKPDAQPKYKPGKEPDYLKITGKKDRYGIYKGTKTSAALEMFEKGCTMRDAELEHGDSFYNVLRKLHKRGHRVDKLENKVLRLIHKDDVGKKKGK